ncbi:MAG: GIY-YIG nuclease family protein [Allosphingosinicella sp.]
MISRDDRKAAAAAWKERKASAGIYVLRCLPTGQVWVGRATDLEAAEQRLRFSLRMASTPHRSLLAAAREHGERAFTFEAVERIGDDDSSPEFVQSRLKTRVRHWQAELGAEPL